MAQIRFAEDARGDFLDTAGMDEADLKYFEKTAAGEVPEWKKEKKQRREGAVDDDSLESQIGGATASEGMESDLLEQAAEAAPVTMVADDLAIAQRLDAVNLQVARWLILLGIIFVITDYLRRANIYGEAYWPLRLPSVWLNTFTAAPVMFTRPETPRRSVPEELEWLHKRGDAYLYIGSENLPDDVVRITDAVDDDFVFESLWYGRSSFALDSSERATQLLGRFTELLEERKATRAKVAQTVHVVLDQSDPTDPTGPADLLQPFAKQAAATGFSIFVCR